ncbi:DNA mismatch repair protein MutS [Parachlamydia acanthamoebae]|uniref:DNA mismatch repair protein MutS n=1 Tax=Parachlamydia acanthamoebae (strain UV7) TaxID=765952 RepID=F8L179_PARAV|nr:DNA mismatch repair protein MutS [Parachlamydia acanthamoebae]CCB87001.1 DNA mismatch repair protein mutS [Parachlamydia acanthamoebae UV-7]
MDLAVTSSQNTQDQKVSPMMVQWQTCKEQAGSAILLFRMGDFYEAFYEDAALLAKEADLTLTRRQGIPMSGVPHHSSEAYIDKLVSKGYRVAIAEQVESAKETKGLVKREIVRVVTPGTVITSSLLAENTNNFFASIIQVGALYGLAFLDLTTSEFRVIEFEHEQELLNEVCRLNPAEFLTSQKFANKHPLFFEEIRKNNQVLVNTHDDWHFEHQVTYNFLIQHFKVHSLDGFGLKGMVPGVHAAGALLQYLQSELSLPIEHITDIQPYTTSQYLSLDRMTLRHLELIDPLNHGSRKNTLLGVLDHSNTPMGARLLRQWIKQPLLSIPEIHQRQEAVQAFYDTPSLMQRIGAVLEQVRDLERLMMRISSGYATPRDLVALRFSMEPLPEIKTLLLTLASQSALLATEAQRIDFLPEMTRLIANALVDDPPVKITEGKIFRDGYHPELDELREISRDSKSWIARYQTQIRDETGLKSLKVGFNRMFGYYIEVSKGQAEKMPDSFQRRQTLVNAERFITPELKNYEAKVLNAEERISAIENELFQTLRQQIGQFSKQVLTTAQALARIDCLRSLGEAARTNQYIRPLVDDSAHLKIVDGRHPVIEAAHAGEKFIPNDTLLDGSDNRLLLITGPNMAGKSTYIRQVALITIMAQMGSFIPAKEAHVGLIDKVFTRIGASDDLSRGQSTFMVEMVETANILHNATSRSLVILDEIGRGTSTYDGISIAWSVAEHLLITEGKMAKTLFATHYWELTKLEEKIPGAVNYNVAVQENADNIIFLRKIIKGGTDKSYGIHVGRLAGLPPSVITRAKEILVHLEENANQKSVFEPSKPKRQPAKKKPISNAFQLTFFG